MLVHLNETFHVGDHDFTKFSLISSVALSVDIPTDVAESWYAGDVFIGLKEGVFKPSSWHRHMAELLDIIHSLDLLSDKSVLFLYSDGAPDHHLTYTSIQLSHIALSYGWIWTTFVQPGQPLAILGATQRSELCRLSI